MQKYLALPTTPTPLRQDPCLSPRKTRMNQDASKTLRQEVANSAEQALAATRQALEATRELASQAIEQTGARARDLREGVKDASAAAQRQLGRYARSANRYVADEPVKSALIASAVGAVVAALVLALLRDKPRRDR